MFESNITLSTENSACSGFVEAFYAGRGAKHSEVRRLAQLLETSVLVARALWERIVKQSN